MNVLFAETGMRKCPSVEVRYTLSYALNITGVLRMLPATPWYGMESDVALGLVRVI